MKKLVSIALTLLAASFIPASAMALNADDGANTFQVRILTARDDERDAGEWYLELDSDSGTPGQQLSTCDYALEWVSPFYGAISTDCVLREYKVHGRKSCIRNAVKNFPTFVDLDPQCACQGFSELGLLEDVEGIMLSENRNGLSGVIMLSGPTGTVHGVIIRDS